MQPLRASCDQCGCRTGAKHALECTRAVCEATGLPWWDCPCPKSLTEEAAKAARQRAEQAARDRGTLPEDVFDLTAADQLAPNAGEFAGHAVSRYQGEWPYDAAARSLGLWLRWNVDRGSFERCRPNEAGAGPDVERIQEVGQWNRREHCWEPRMAVLYVRLASSELPPPPPMDVRLDEIRQGETNGAGPRALKELLDVKSYPLRRWVLETGFQIVGEFHDVGRMGRGWAAVLRSVDEGARPWAGDGAKAQIVAVDDQRDLGSSNKVRLGAIQKVKDRGGRVLSRKLWDDDGSPPLSAQLRYAIDARAVMGPEPTED